MSPLTRLDRLLWLTRAANAVYRSRTDAEARASEQTVARIVNEIEAEQRAEPSADPKTNEETRR